MNQQHQDIYPSMERDTGTPPLPTNILADIQDIMPDCDQLQELLMSGFEFLDDIKQDPHEQPETQTHLAFPGPGPGPISSIRDRLSRALKYVLESQQGHDLLVQIWVPTTIGDRKMLTTIGQPYTLDSSSYRLVKYRSVSKDFYFSADEESGQSLGLPGRVFVGRMPEWTPDARLFKEFEYPRVGHARSCDIKGTMALPIFAKGDRNCLGVIELVTTTRKINYGLEIESICNALQAVDLRSCEVQTVPRLKFTDTSYQLALPELGTVLRSVCETHNLPLAQIWISCMQQGKYGPRHSDENYSRCISTVDSATYVQDETFLPFHQSCSDHHLLKGEGVAGRAFLTNKPCFSPDVTSFSKIEYPLAHHAKLFNLHGAVAVRLRHVSTGRVDFVLEFFLPVDCTDLEAQRSMLDSLSLMIQQACHGLRGITQKEIEEETKVMEGPVKDEQEVFSVTAGWDSCGDNISFSELGFDGEDFLVKEEVDLGEPGFLNGERGTEKKRTKAEKNVSLQELRKHFAGSLKDAAKNLGVCPTTLKRICRQHGITRWPSRKIKKVGHSLQKLQMVIDSVHGPEGGGVQLSSLYDSFAMSVWSEKDLPSTSSTENQREQNLNGKITSRNSASNSSSCSHSSTSSLSNPASTNPQNAVTPLTVEQEISLEEKQKNKHDHLKVKVIYGEEKVIFRLHLNSGFRDLKQEVAKRFGFADPGSFELKYLDDESEWVLLTCDADLHECVDVYKSSSMHAIKISVCPSSISQAYTSTFNHLG